MLWACEQIYNLFAQQWYYYWDWNYYDWVPYAPVYGHLFNNHAQITSALVKAQIIDCEQNHEFSTVLYLGHGGIEGGQYNIFEQASHNEITNPPLKIIDNQHIYPYTVDNHHFVFLWACRQGDEAGDGSPPHGMPYCWTRQPNLSPDGYNQPDSRPYCFIGFEAASPRLSEWMNPNNIYKYWLVFFYYFALYVYGQWYGWVRIWQALDHASWMVGYPGGWLDPNNTLSKGFWTHWPFPAPPGYPQPGEYWGKMRIYGDGNIWLPQSVWWY